MSDFLHRLAARSLGMAAVAEPIIAASTVPADSFQPEPALAAYTERTAPVVPSEISEAMRVSAIDADEPRAIRRNREIVPVEVPPAQPGVRKGLDETVVAARPGTPISVELVSKTLPPPRPRFMEIPRSNPVPQQTPGAGSVRMAAAQAPVVRVTIGRIEVRAQFPAPAAKRESPGRATPNGLSLDDYLKQRNEGRR